MTKNNLDSRECIICGNYCGDRKTCSDECLSEYKSKMATNRRKNTGYRALGYYSIWNDGKI